VNYFVLQMTENEPGQLLGPGTHEQAVACAADIIACHEPVTDEIEVALAEDCVYGSTALGGRVFILISEPFGKATPQMRRFLVDSGEMTRVVEAQDWQHAAALAVRIEHDSGNPPQQLGGVGCLLIAIAFCIVWWAILGFPRFW
jgi:hypothetical protein